MGIYAKGGASDQCTVVFSRSDAQICGIMGQHSIDGIHLIGKDFVQYLQIENISLPQLIQVRKHFLTCHAGMGSQNRVCAFPANREGTAQQVSDPG